MHPVEGRHLDPRALSGACVREPGAPSQGRHDGLKPRRRLRVVVYAMREEQGIIEHFRHMPISFPQPAPQPMPIIPGQDAATGASLEVQLEAGDALGEAALDFDVSRAEDRLHRSIAP